jgi:hypothetical protein
MPPVTQPRQSDLSVSKKDRQSILEHACRVRGKAAAGKTLDDTKGSIAVATSRRHDHLMMFNRARRDEDADVLSIHAIMTSLWFEFFNALVRTKCLKSLLKVSLLNL